MIEIQSWIRRIKNNSWRWQLKKRQVIRWFQYSDWKNDLPSLRWLVLLLIVGLSVISIDALFCWVTDCGYGWFSFCATKALLANVTQANTPASATVLLALYSAPAAYIIWWFRDANNRQQIENQRKDVNLKDFQRLAEWAAGMHLPEDKVVESEKKTNNLETKKTESATNPSEEKTSNTTETNRSIESFIAPKNYILHTPSRREGAASLQIAAIYQLQAFLQGEYGKQFQRPAFQLLKSIWLTLVMPHLVVLDSLMQQEQNFVNAKEKVEFKTLIDNWINELDAIVSQPIGYAINSVLGIRQGWLLRCHAVDLPNTVLAGFNSDFNHLTQKFELDGLQLRGIQLQGANMNDANLQGANLSHAKLQGVRLMCAKLQQVNLGGANLLGAKLACANLSGACLNGAILKGAFVDRVNLQDAGLSHAELQGAYLCGTKFERADLSHAKLHRANLMNADLQSAYLDRTELQGATLINANLRLAKLSNIKLQGANLFNAQLDGTVLFNIEVENATFEKAKTDAMTHVFIGEGHAAFFPESSRMIDAVLTFAYREKLRNENQLVLPEILYKQLFAKPTEYTVLNSIGEVEKKFGVGLRTEF